MGRPASFIDIARSAESRHTGLRNAIAGTAHQMLALIGRRRTPREPSLAPSDGAMPRAGGTNESLAIACHELRTPLACARHALRVLAQPTTDDRTRKLLHDVLDRQVRHMSHLVEDLLAAPHGARTRLEIRSGRIDLRAVVNHAIEANMHAIAARDHDLTVAMPEVPAWVWGDGVRLEQVFGNLLGNATKYTRHGGRISVWMHLREGSVVVRIRDTGIGIAPALLPRVFELYRQADGSDRSPGTGLGIGLTVVHDLVQLHGGSVSAASGGKGCGSEFTVCLPLRIA